MKSFLFCVVIPFISSQTVSWTWQSGSSGVNQIGSYIVKGSPSPNVYPGARYSHCGILHPLTNEFIVFGGSIPSAYVSDLWSYDFNANIWTWLSGSNVGNQAGNYGTRGVSSSTNQPGGRSDSAMDIHPVSGLLVMFGGYGYDSSTFNSRCMNDLWTFDFSSIQWTWRSGSSVGDQEGAYGTKGIASTSNRPGSRYGHSLNIHTSTGNVLVFAGYGIDQPSVAGSPGSPGSSGGGGAGGAGGTAASYGFFNDLWSYDLATNAWRWISGSNLVDPSAFYGTKGLASSSNVPAYRIWHSSTINSKTGNLIISGGSRENNNYLNDLWMYDFNTNMWTWLSGSSSLNQAGTYGTMGVSSSTNVPGSRRNHQISYLPLSNSLVLFGGYNGNYMNDFWLYNFQTNLWMWLSGSNIPDQQGVYGSKGVLNSANVAGSRSSLAFDCYQTTQKCVLFGGYGHDSTKTLGSLNDIWVLGFSAFTLQVKTSSQLSLTLTQTPQTKIPSTSQLSKSESVFVFNTPESTPAAIVFVSQNSTTSQDLGETQLVLLSDIPESKTSSTKTSRTRILPQIAANLDFFQRYQTVLIYGILSLIFLLFCLLFYKCSHVKHGKHATTPSTISISSASQSIAQISSSFTTSTASTGFSTRTRVPANQGISIPGFLQFQYGLDYVVRREIARGGFGAVYKAHAHDMRLKVFGDTIIVKQVIKEQLNLRDIRLFHQEVAVMYFLQEHRNIAKLVGFSEKPYCLLMKFYDRGSLDDWIKADNIEKPVSLAISFLLDISRGVQVMHTKGLVHCDLKPQNILLDSDQSGLFCVLTDFGITQIVTAENLLVKAFEVVNIRGASIAYAAPEALHRVRRRQEIPEMDLLMCDIYALGIIQWELVNKSICWL